MRFSLHHKTPLPLVLGILLNLALIIALEVLLIYKYPVPPDSSSLSTVDPNFEDCSFLMDSHVDRTHFVLADNRNGRQYIVPFRTHPFFYNRCRIYSREIKEVDARTGTQAFRLGWNVYHVTAYPGYLRTEPPGVYIGKQSVLSYYLGFSALLTLVELGILESRKQEN